MDATSEHTLDKLGTGDELLKLSQIAALRNHPGWAALTEHIQGKIDSTVQGFSRALLNGADFDQRRVDRTRGQVNALRAVMNAPQVAHQAYVRAKRKDQ